ncbi:MAG: hypothetical protein MUC65_00825, partial [Pontiellaceae bacterium]|nr:hypothetical protein [Pontiellaceae bacterium]
FHIRTLNKKRRSAGQRLADELAKSKTRTLEQLRKCFEAVIPKRLLVQNDSGSHSRSRIFTKENIKPYLRRYGFQSQQYNISENVYCSLM